MLRFIDVGAGLHEIIFGTEAVCSLAPLRPALDRALARWKCLWDIHKNRTPSDAQDHIGFYKNASEYWWLAKLFLDNNITSPTGRDKKEFDHDSMKDVNDFIKRFTQLTIT